MTSPDVRALLETARRHEQAGSLAAAEDICRSVLAAEPYNAAAHNILGMAVFRSGRYEEALACFGRAVELAGDVPEYHNNLGGALKTVGRHEEAAACFRRAAELRPGYGTAWYNLSLVLLAAGRAGESADAARAAVRLAPGDADAWKQLSVACQKAGATQEAVDAAERAVRLSGRDADMHIVRGSALLMAGRSGDAAAAFRRAVELRPDMADAHNNLGNALQSAGLLDEALAAFARAASLSRDAAIVGNLANMLVTVGMVDSAIEHHRSAIRACPQNPVVHSNLLLALHYRHGWDGPMLLAEHRAWAHRHAEPLARLGAASVAARGSRGVLRVGYISPDFAHHPVGLFMRPIVGRHDRRRVEVYCYADVLWPDDLTAEFQRCADAWRDVRGMDDEALARLIRDDGVDIAVDLAGHTARNRLLALARRPAPVQMTYLGYPNTTGMSAIDWRITDAACDPPGQTEAFHVERLLRLPTCFVCFRPPDARPVSDLPARRNGYITFGSFNNLAKVSPQALRAWARIMQQAPRSRLLLKARGLAAAPARRYVLDHLDDIAADRVVMLPHTATYREHLAAWGAVDVALDTFPYCGTTTTCEALWMGVPVVSLAGPVHVGRVGLSLLTAAGLPQLACASVDEYVRTAAELAGDPERVAALRTELRQRLGSSALCDEDRFIRELEDAYAAAWRSSGGG